MSELGQNAPSSEGAQVSGPFCAERKSRPMPTFLGRDCRSVFSVGMFDRPNTGRSCR